MAGVSIAADRLETGARRLPSTVGMDVRGLRITLAVTATALLGLAGAAPAQAAFGVTVNKAEPVSKNAGANSQFDLDVSFTGGEDVKDLTVHLPPGLVGDPTSTPFCTETQLNADMCPVASQIGTTTTTATVFLPSDTVINGSVYNVQPRTGEPARLGVVLRPDPPAGGTVILQSPAKLRPTDFGLDTVLEDIPNTAVVSGLTVPITIARIQLSLNGAFMRNPTSCGTQKTTADAVSYSGTAATGMASFTSANCAALPFSPAFEGKIGSPGHTGFPLPAQTTVISQDEGEAGLRRAQVTLPEDLGGNNIYLSNQCPMANFVAHTCPEASIVGQATAESPLQTQALTGPMALVEQPGRLPLLGLDLQGPLALQLFGDLVLVQVPDSDDFETQVVFSGLPDIPISRFQLTLVEDRLNVVGRDLCEPPDSFYKTNFTSHADEVVTGQTKATIEGCPPPVVDPTASLKLKGATSGKPRLRARVSEGSAAVDQVVVNAPDGVRFREGKYRAEADGQALSNTAVAVTRKAITITAPDTQELRLRAAGGAVKVKSSVGQGDELPFSIGVTDADSNDFTLATPVTASR
jgi:hypothetical protein